MNGLELIEKLRADSRFKSLKVFALAGAALPLCAESSFELQRAEFAKYYKRITGRDAPDGAVRFAIDPKVSKSGKDAYSIVTTDGRAACPQAAATLADRIEKAVKSGDRKARFPVRQEMEGMRRLAKSKPLESLKPTLPRTAESFRKVLGEVLKPVK